MGADVTKHPALDAVNELVKPHKLTIDITPTIRYTVTAPCLLRQLATCITLGTEHGGRGVPASRAPANADVLDLWHHMAHNTHAWARELGGINRRDPRDHHPIPWIGRLLRTTTATAVSKGLTEMADRIETNTIRWTAQINAIITGRPETRGIRGATCPTCTTLWVTEERQGEGNVRMPAICLTVRQVDAGLLRWLTCIACGWSQALSDDVTALVWSTTDERIDA